MYKVSEDTMRTMIGPGKYYENYATLANEIQNQGIKAAFQELPLKDRETFLKTNPGRGDARDQAFMTQYSGQVAKALDNKVAIGNVWREKNWQQMDMTGP